MLIMPKIMSKTMQSISYQPFYGREKISDTDLDHFWTFFTKKEFMYDQDIWWCFEQTSWDEL